MNIEPIESGNFQLNWTQKQSHVAVKDQRNTNRQYPVESGRRHPGGKTDPETQLLQEGLLQAESQIEWHGSQRPKAAERA